MRHHVLEGNGDLKIDYMVMREDARSNKLQYSNIVPEIWKHDAKSVSIVKGANHIGIGYYRSPVETRGIPTDEGVPLDFGCAEIIEAIREHEKDFREEFKNSKNRIFADPRVLKYDEITGKYEVKDNIFTVAPKSGTNGAKLVESYAPAIRYMEYYNRKQDLYAELENQMKLSRGIYTTNQVTAGATATEVRRSNKDTIAMIDDIHTMLDKGDEMTLEACGLYLNIRRELWEYHSDYYDPFDDAGEQWNYLKSAYDAGAVSIKRLTKWVYPNMSDKEIEQELTEAGAEKQSSTNSAIMQALNM